MQGFFSRFVAPPRRTQRPPERPAVAVAHPSLSALKPLERPSLKNVALSLVAAPMVVFFAASISFAVLWESAAVATALTVVALLVALPVSMPHADLKAHLAAGDVLVPVSLCLLAAVAGVIDGVCAYEYHMAPFYAMSLGHSYDNVLASAEGAAYYDAGKLRFAETSAVQTELALGYRQSPRYCVAPILDSGEQSRKVSFWAIGMDCCGTRGSFTCGAIKGSARGGVRAIPNGFFVQSRRQYVNAMKQAAAVADLAVDDDPILVHWVEDPTGEQWRQFLGALSTIGLGSLLFCLVTLFAAFVENARSQRSSKDAASAAFELAP